MKQNKIRINENTRFEKYQNSLWQVIMFNYAKHDGKKLSEENEALKTDPQAQPSDAERKKYHKLLDKELRKNKIRSVIQISKKLFTKIAVVVFVFILGFALLFTTVEAFRVQVLNLILDFQEEYVGIRLGDNNTTEGIKIDWHDYYIPLYIPEGYITEQITKMDNFKSIYYLNSEGNFIEFMEHNSSYGIGVDTEDAEILKSIKVHEEDGVFVLKKGIATVSWTFDNKIFIISTQLNEEETMKIAESVIYIK